MWAPYVLIYGPLPLFLSKAQPSPSCWYPLIGLIIPPKVCYCFIQPLCLFFSWLPHRSEMAQCLVCSLREEESQAERLNYLF